MFRLEWESKPIDDAPQDLQEFCHTVELLRFIDESRGRKGGREGGKEGGREGGREYIDIDSEAAYEIFLCIPLATLTSKICCLFVGERMPSVPETCHRFGAVWSSGNLFP